MAELSLVHYLIEGMKPHWSKAVKHADAYTAGIADVSAYLSPAGNIWIELKALKTWPKRADTPVKFSLGELQKEFLIARKGWMFCRVGRQYLLFDHNDAYWLVDSPDATRALLERIAVKQWFNKVDWQEFATCVGKRYE